MAGSGLISGDIGRCDRDSEQAGGEGDDCVREGEGDNFIGVGDSFGGVCDEFVGEGGNFVGVEGDSDISISVEDSLFSAPDASSSALSKPSLSAIAYIHYRVQGLLSVIIIINTRHKTERYHIT